MKRKKSRICHQTETDVGFHTNRNFPNHIGRHFTRATQANVALLWARLSTRIIRNLKWFVLSWSSIHRKIIRNDLGNHVFQALLARINLTYHPTLSLLKSYDDFYFFNFSHKINEMVACLPLFLCKSSNAIFRRFWTIKSKSLLF